MADYDYSADGSDAADGEGTPHDLQELDRKLKAWFREDMRHVSEWRKGAKEDFQFYSGDQWAEADRNVLAQQQRPALVFNRIAPLVNAVTGSEVNNRREVRFIPREQGDALANEVLTAAAEWFRDESDAEDEESDSFEDAVICGMGWTDTRLDYICEPDGAPKIERMDSMEMVWDCYATKPNLIDARRIFRVREVSFDEAETLTGESDPQKLNATWVKSTDENEPHDQQEAKLYQGTQNEQADGYYSKKCILVEARWLAPQVYYRGPDLENPGQIREYDQKQVELLRKQIPQFPAVKQTRQIVRRAFIGSSVLGKPDTPLAPPGMFGWECITGYRDKVKGTFYGIVKAAKDPQRWSNKFFSQVQFLLNSQSKGGIIAERGAFEDDRQAEASWARSDNITWAKQGTISSDKPKIMPKSPAQFPAGFWTLFQEAKDEISQVTGLSPEFIGTREVDQAGVLEYQRRQSSLNLLASLFNSLRRYRKRQGRVMLYLIQNYLADGRLVRIVGNDMKQYVPLTKENVASAEYDIIVDDAPSSPNEKDRTWQILMQMLPMVKEFITPEIAIELLSASPLPASLVENIKRQAAAKAQQPQPPSPEEIKAQSEQQSAQLDAQGKVMDLQVKQQSNQMDLQSKAVDLMMKEQEAQLNHAAQQDKLQLQAQSLALKAESNRIAAQNANSRQTSAAN